MFLYFRRIVDSVYLEFEINRENKRLKFIGEQTNYVKQELPWRMLWDRCEDHKKKLNEDNTSCGACRQVEVTQDEQMQALNDSEFVKVFEKQMEVYGYDLVRWQP